MTFNMSKAGKLGFSHIRMAVLTYLKATDTSYIIHAVKVISDATRDEVYFINREKNRQVFKNPDYFLLTILLKR